MVRCDMCEHEPAVMLMTNIDSGDVIAVGTGCLPAFHLAGVSTLLDGAPAEVAASYAPQVAGLAKIVGLIVIEAGDGKPAPPGEPPAAPSPVAGGKPARGKAAGKVTAGPPAGGDGDGPGAA